MHEYSIVQALYDNVAAQAAERHAVTVHGVQVRIGELSGVDVGLLETAWKTFRVHTICEHAPMGVSLVRARWECKSCGVESPPGSVLRCAACGGSVSLAQGDEIVLERIVMEVRDV
jgi:hydrogenase nickel incorporation protein HypA/HybF